MTLATHWPLILFAGAGAFALASLAHELPAIWRLLRHREEG